MWILASFYIIMALVLATELTCRWAAYDYECTQPVTPSTSGQIFETPSGSILFPIWVSQWDLLKLFHGSQAVEKQVRSCAVMACSMCIVNWQIGQIAFVPPICI